MFERQLRPRTRIALLAGAALLLTGVALVLARPPAPAPEHHAILERIASHSDFHWDMDVSRNGTHAAYAHGYGVPGLHVIELATGAVTRVPTRRAMPRKPALSPDGRYVAFQSYGGGAALRELYLYDRVSERETVLAALDAHESYVNDPTFSPDGALLAYTRTWPQDDRWQSQLRLVELASGRDRVLYAGPARAPSFSPDGARLAFLDGANLMLTTPAGDEPRQLAAIEGSPAPSVGYPDAPVWSPDGSALAYAVEHDDCHRIHLVDAHTGATRELEAGCAIRPSWIEGGRSIAFVGLGSSTRTLHKVAVEGGPVQALGFDDGLVYQHEPAATGELVVLGMPSWSPRALWRVATEPGVQPTLIRSSLEPPLPMKWISRPRSTTVGSAGDLEIPLQIFPRTCGDGPGPAILWIHGGPNEDVAPRWYQEIQYLAALGVTVVAVNYRGSTGNGRAFRELGHDRFGQIADIAAALRYTRALDEVDGERVGVFLVSSAAYVTYQAAQADGALAALVDWVGSPNPWLGEAPPNLARLPEMLWISGTEDRITHSRRSALAGLPDASSIEHVEVAAGHAVLNLPARQASLTALRRYLARTLEPRCAD